MSENDEINYLNSVKKINEEQIILNKGTMEGLTNMILSTNDQIIQYNDEINKLTDQNKHIEQSNILIDSIIKKLQ